MPAYREGRAGGAARGGVAFVLSPGALARGGGIGPFLLTAALACSEPVDPGAVEPSEQGIAWLRQAAIAFQTVDPAASHDELGALRDVIGDARVVVLGEANHGAREFFLLKHRLVRFLVEEMGFNTFAMEATWPESNLVDDYLATGRGEPEVLLSRLYFWIWNTREVLDLIEWMRQYNRSAGGRRIRFGGFDIQYPRMAMDQVVEFAGRVDTAAAAWVVGRYACFRPYVNELDGSFRRLWDYTLRLTGRAKLECRARAQEVYDTLLARRTRFVAATSPLEFERALQSSRIVVQNQHMRFNSVADQDTRDMYMAENALWLIRQSGPQARVVIWTHNFHAADQHSPWRSMGSYLREALGQELVLVGFSLYEGSFNADNPLTGERGPQRLPPARAGSYEHVFHRAGLPRLMLDLRRLEGAPEEMARWLRGPQRFRSIGTLFRPDRSYVYESPLSSEYDVVIHFEHSTPTTLLPFRFPGS